MVIRKTTVGDLDSVMRIYEEAREFMCENGNPTQWRKGTPERELIECDIREEKSYVCLEDEIIIGVFCFSTEREPVYDTLNGNWLDGDNCDENNKVCGVIHRLAKADNAPKGVGGFCINWCFELCGNIKIDTHDDNAPMLKLLGNLGFVYCGIVSYPDGGKRIAFQKNKHKK